MFELWQEQVDVVDEVRGAIRMGYKSILIVAPTGSGKTVIGADIIHKAETKGNGSIFTAHRRELIRQCADKLSTFGVLHGIIMATEPRNHFAGVQVASVDTLRARHMNPKKKNQLPLPSTSIFMVDEAHRSVSPTYTKLIDHYKEAGAIIIGLTATPIRGDGKGLGRHYDYMVLAPSMQELIDNGRLVPPRYFAPTVPDLTGVQIARGDYVEGQLEKVMDTREAVGDIITNHQRICPDRPTIVFAASVRNSIHIAEEFRAAGVSAEHLDGTTEKEDRDAILARVESGETQVVCNCMVLTEGFDCPKLSCAILHRPTRNLGLFIQMAGRVLRTFPGKEDGYIIDHSGNIYEHGMLEEDHGWSLDDTGACTEREERQKTLDEKKPITCMHCSHIYTGQLVCPKCGNVPEKRGEAIDSRHADLIEIRTEKREAEAKKKAKNAPATHEEKQQWYSMFYSYARNMGHAEGSVAHKYKEKFGVWPINMEKISIEPSPDCLSYITHLNIKRAHQRKKQK